MTTVSAQGHNVRNCLVEARRVLKVPLQGHREKLRSGEDGLYRVELESGHIVECTLINHAKSEAHIEIDDPLGDYHGRNE